jgi:hypothetical protein
LFNKEIHQGRRLTRVSYALGEHLINQKEGERERERGPPIMLPSPQRRGQRQRQEQQQQQQQSPGVLRSAAAVLFGFKNNNSINSNEQEENSSTSGPNYDGVIRYHNDDEYNSSSGSGNGSDSISDSSIESISGNSSNDSSAVDDEDFADYVNDVIITQNDEDEKNELRKTISILTNKSKLPMFVQKELKILTHNFLKDTKNIAQEFLCDGHLNKDIDTKQQLTTLVDYFPETLSHRYRYPRYPIQAACGILHHHNRNHNDQNRQNQNNQNHVMKPVLECNVKALPFIPTLIELGRKHNNVFGDNNEMRLGILSSDRYGYNLFDYLTCDTILSSSTTTMTMTNNNCNEKRIIEEKLLDMMKQLRGMNLILKEDISKYDLLFKSLSGSSSTASRPFSQRFRYLVNWYPNGLKKKAETEDEDGIDDDNGDDDDGDNGNVLLHYSTMITDFQHSSSSSSSKLKSKSPGQNTNIKNRIQLEERIRPFQLALKAGVRHFPNEIGFLFHKNNNGITPYDLACNQYGEIVTLNVVRQICYTNPNSGGGHDDDDHGDDGDTSHAGLDSLLGGFMETKKTVPLKSFLLAAIDNDIKVDSIYVQLRQDPNMIQKLILLVEKDNDNDNNEGVEYWDYYNDNNNEDGGGGDDDRGDSNTECDFVIPALPVLSFVRLFTIVVDEWKRVTRT